MTEIVLTTLTKTDLEALIISSMTAVINAQSQRTPEPPPAPADDDLLTKRQAAAMLKCSTSTISNFARAGKLQRYYLGRVVRFKRGEVLNLIGRKVKS